VTLSITHTTIATFPDEPGAEINKAEWNAAHALTGTLDPSQNNVAVDGVTITGDGTPGNPLVAAGGGSGVALESTITQAAHGFSVGQLVYLVGATYTLALADDAVSAEVVGIVSAVADANTFTLTTSGLVTGLSGLTAGTVYFLSPTVAGALTSTQPTTDGQVVKPVFVADSTTTGYFINYRGEVITSSGGGGVTISQATVDFGAFSYMATTDIVDATVTSSTYVMTSIGGTGGRDADELEFSPLSVAAIVTDGVGYQIIASAPNGADGQFNINYFKG